MTVYKNFEISRNLKAAGQLTASEVSISSGVITINPNTSRYFVVTVDGDITTINITTPKMCLQFLVLFQFGGSYSISGWPVSIEWIGANTPSAGASGEEILASFTYWNSSIGFRADSSPNYVP
jgi:hypothetical protein